MPDEYRCETIALTKQVQDTLLRARDEDRFRLRLVLRERQDLKLGNRRVWNPLYVHDYHFGRPHLIRGVDEVVIERCDGSRYRMDRTTAPWTTQLLVEERAIRPD